MTVATWTTAVGWEVREICLTGDETTGFTTVEAQTISTGETAEDSIRGMITTMVDEGSMIEVATEMGTTTMDTIGRRGADGIR